MSAGVVAGVATGLAVLLCLPPRRHLPASARLPVPARTGGVLRQRGAAAALALVAGLTWAPAVLGPVAGPVAGLVAAAAVWHLAGRGTSSADRRAEDRAHGDLPHLVGLVADALRSGADPATAVRQAALALPGPASDRLLAATQALGWGADPVDVWQGVAADPVLAPLGRALDRAHAMGTPVSGAVTLLSEHLAHEARAGAEDRARRVGVRAAVPLGLCLLPAFVALGIVPVAATLLGDLW